MTNSSTHIPGLDTLDTRKSLDEKYCESCGKVIKKEAVICPECGVPVRGKVFSEGASDKSRLVALLLCWFFGMFGVHRFYVGKTGTGILWLVTLGFLGIGTLIDCIIIIAGSFKDSEGRKILLWQTN